MNQTTICKSSNRILAGLLRGDSKFTPNVMYVEFQSTGTNVPIPAITPADDHLQYYLDLREGTLGDRDFLRIPIVSVTPVTLDDPDNIELYFNGVCTGAIGVGGKSTANSRIYGIALASSPTYGTDIDDLTKDILWARGYFDPSNQMQFSNIAQTLITFKLKLST